MRRQTDKQKWSQTDSWAGKQTGRLHRSRCADSRDADNSSGGNSCIKVIGMLVVSLRGVTFRIWSNLEYLGWKGIVLAHSCQLSLRAVHKEIYKEMPWQSSFRGQLKLQSHPPWFPLGVNFNFPTSIPFICLGSSPPGNRITDIEHADMHTADRQTNEQRKRDLQICRQLAVEKQTIRQQKSRDTGSREADKRTADRGRADKEKQIFFPAVCRLYVYSSGESAVQTSHSSEPDMQTIAYRRKQTSKRAVMDVATDRSL